MLWTEDFGAISGELAERGNKQAVSNIAIIRLIDYISNFFGQNVTFVPSNDPISNCFYSTDPFAVKCDNLFRATAW